MQHESDGMQRWMELKDKALTARSSRPSQGLGEIQGMPWIRVGLTPTQSSRQCRSAGRRSPAELPDGPVFLYGEPGSST